MYEIVDQDGKVITTFELGEAQRAAAFVKGTDLQVWYADSASMLQVA